MLHKIKSRLIWRGVTLNDLIFSSSALLILIGMIGFFTYCMVFTSQ